MALPENTASYFSKFPHIKSKILGKTRFHSSICGFGCYRIDDGNSKHYKALETALLSGINLIDTSSNYSDGGSELLIGKVLAKLIEKKEVDREEIILISKGGYLQGNNLKLGIEREKEGIGFKDVVKCSPDLWHCISPDFLENQITLSLKRLQLIKIDVYLLHNPEYYLTYSLISDPERREKEYYKRIKEAFIQLEKEVEQGRISYYGISSNTFGEKNTKSNFTSLEKVVELADQVSPKNHFAVVQFPMNLIESGGMNNLNQSNGSKTFLQIAEENNLGVLVNRPLNAIFKNKLIRLADYPITENRSQEEIFDLINDLAKQEKILIDKYVNYMESSASEKKDVIDCLSLSNTLKINYRKFDNPSDFQEIKVNYFVPRANFAIDEMGKNLPDETNLTRSLRNYAVTTNILLSSIISDLGHKKNEKNEVFHKSIDKYLKNEQKKLSLSQKAILLINSVPQVTSTLVGMRNEEYVKDVLNSIKTEYLVDSSLFWHNNSATK
jgi:aryl-alcohol dehydrogenase-like predicted oxidoreductase